MPPAKLGYSSSVKRGSGSSRKYSFSVPAMAFTSISLIITATSLLSVQQMRWQPLEYQRLLRANWAISFQSHFWVEYETVLQGFVFSVVYMRSISTFSAVFFPTFFKSQINEVKTELTWIKSSLQRLDVSCNTRHSVDSHLLHPSSFNLLHTLSHDEGNLGTLSPSKDKVTQKVLKGLLTN